MSGRHVSHELYGLVAGTLSNSELLVVNDHLGRCESCRCELVDASFVHALVGSVSDLLAPEFEVGSSPGASGAGALPALGPVPGPVGSPVAGDLAHAGSRRHPPRRFERPRRPTRPTSDSRPARSIPSTATPLALDELGSAQPRATAQLHRRRPATSRRGAPTPTRRSSRLRRSVVVGLLAVVAVAALYGAGAKGSKPNLDGNRIILSAALEPRPGAGGATGTITVRADGDLAVVTAGLAPAPAGHYYEVWLVALGRASFVAVGRLPADGRGQYVLPAASTHGIAGIAIRLQRAGAPPAAGWSVLSTLAPAGQQPARSGAAPTAGPGHGRADRPAPSPVVHRTTAPPTTVATKTDPGPPTQPAARPAGWSSPPAFARKLLDHGENRPPARLELEVDSPSDAPGVDPASGRCRDAAGACSLRAAIEVANASRVAATVRVPAGTFALTLGPLVVSDPGGVSIVGASIARSTIAVRTRSSRALVVEGGQGSRDAEGVTLSLGDLSVTGGTAPATGRFAGDGGAILVERRSDALELSQVAIDDSQASLGGAVYDRGGLWTSEARFAGDHAGELGGAALLAGGSAVFSRSTFTSDEATAGGAIDDEGAVLVVVYSTFAGDAAASATGAARGGAIDVRAPSWLASDQFFGDHAAASGAPTAPAGGGEGGAVYVAGGPVLLVSAHFLNDVVTGGDGGAVFNAATDTIGASQFVDDRATGAAPSGSGGAIASAGKLVLVASHLSDDAAGNDGGALEVSGTATVGDSRFSDDRAGATGGGIADLGTVEVNRSTLTDGAAKLGAGIFVDGALHAVGDAVLDNVASGSGSAGGGLFLLQAVGAHGVQVERSTVAGNVAPIGAGITVDRAGAAPLATIAASELAANDLPSGIEQDCAVVGEATGPFLEGAHDVVGGTSCGLDAGDGHAAATAQAVWLVDAAGVVRTCNIADFRPPTPPPASSPVVAIAPAPGGEGFWEVTADGGVDNFGSAGWFGSARGRLDGGRIAGFAATLGGGGYWLVSSTGTVFAFGDAANYGSATGTAVVAIAETADGDGYWLLERTGAVRAFGDAGRFAGPALGEATALAATPDGRGYWVASATGAVRAYGDATNFGGSASSGILALLPTTDGRGYLLVGDRSQVFAHGDATWTHALSPGPVTAAG